MASSVAAEEQSGLLTAKTWVLKVSIHCEGCKRKVTKILQSINGVYKVTVDSKQHKATVIGNVDGETLVKKLLKSGKNAELVPNKVEKKEIKQEVKINEKQNDPLPITTQTPQEQSKPQEEIQVNPKNNNQSDQKPAKISENENPPAKISEDGALPAKIGENGASPAEKSEISGDKSDEKPSEDQRSDEMKPENKSPATDKKENESDDAVKVNEKVVSLGGNDGKKKGKKGQKSKNPEEVETLLQTPASIGTPNPVNLSHPREHFNPYAPYYGGPGSVSVMSYSVAHPSSSYSATYYAQPPPYTYSDPVSASMPPPYAFRHPDSPPLQPPSDSFTMFSDENANGCSIM